MIPDLRAIRRLYAIFFFALFLFFLTMMNGEDLQGYETDWLLALDPLTGLSVILTSGMLYSALAWSVLIVVLTLFFGRFFCSWICPLGILNQFTGYLFSFLRPKEDYARNRYRSYFSLKYYILLSLLVLSLFGALQIGLFDPLALITRSFILGIFPALQQWNLPLGTSQMLVHGGVGLALIFIALILANRFIPRFWCRTLCPLGALLGVLSWRAPFRIRRNVDRCTDCMACMRHCQGACDPQGELRISECHVCLNCIRECPHDALHFGLPGEKSSIHAPIDVSRRRLVETTVAAALFHPMLSSADSSRTEPLPGVIRPPGSLPESDFLARCIKCGACMKVCPTHVLQPALLESGIEGVWTPILIPKLGYCEHHCVLCGQVCPTAAIRPISVAEKVGVGGFKTPVKLGTAFYDRGRCLPWAMQTECIVCEEMCPTSPKAIWYQKKKVVDREGQVKVLKQPFVDPELCIGCGICENKCPVQDLPAIRVSSVGESRSKDNQMILRSGR
ncbi:MAG: 4Fe-4S binding protein [Magnetococcales bacterium]|nr:4Fe-4S binding protein [Magnetococcales bacterium]